MNNNPDNGTLPKDIDTILSELNALCAAHDAQRATRFSPTLYVASHRTGLRPTAVREVGHINEKTAALPVTTTNVPQPVTPLTTPNAEVTCNAVSTVDLIVEYHTVNGRLDARCATTDTIIQVWDRLAAGQGECSHLVIRPYSADDKPLSSRLNALEMFYHSASALLDTAQVSGQNSALPKQTAEPQRVSAKYDAADVLFSDDILPREDAVSQASACPDVTPDLPPPCRVLMMNSRDGAEYAWPVLYPTQWAREDAMQWAKTAVSIVKAEDRLAVQDGETGIGNYRHRLMDELRERGFIVPDTDEGPVWD